MKPGNHPANRIIISNYVVLLVDLFIVTASVCLAYLLRFNFAIPASELKPLPAIVLYIAAVRIALFFAGRSYTGILKYITTLDVLKIYLFTLIGSFIFLLTNLASYYLVNQTLFIPLTIIILEFIITSLFLLTFRGIIKVSHSERLGKGQVEKLRGE